MVAQLEVRLKEGWFSRMMKTEDKPLVKLVKQVTADGGFNKNKQMPGKNALQEGEARIAPKKMAYGGKVKKKGVRRADGCAVRGKTKGRMV